MSKIKDLHRACDTFADRMGWPRVKHNVEHTQEVLSTGRLVTKLFFPATQSAPTRKIVYRQKVRKTVLDDEIELARGRALNPNSAQSIFCELVKLAHEKKGCLIGIDENAIKYVIGDEVKFFTVRHLRQRLKRADNR